MVHSCIPGIFSYSARLSVLHFATRKYLVSADITFFDSVPSSSESMPLPCIVESRILMSMMHILQEKRYLILCRYTDDGHVPRQPFPLHHLQICYLQTFICPFPFRKVYVSPLHIPFSILLAMIAFTLLSVHLPCLLLLSPFLGTTKRQFYYHSGRQP